MSSRSGPKPTVIHVVRRYGPVGGAERYVYELTRELDALGFPVLVLCARSYGPAPGGLRVHELGDTLQRPRWLCLWRFRRRAHAWLGKHRPPGSLIHSHERLFAHDISTYHGPPFAPVRERPPWRRLSLRVRVQLDLERDQIAGARMIVPNSPLIGDLLRRYYPEHGSRIAAAIPPGVMMTATREPRRVPSAGGVVGFVGKEWKRKGLPFAATIVAELQRKRPHLEFRVVGPPPGEIAHLFARWKQGYQLLGWRTDPDYVREFDVLLHPASAEPYGMVITEAMAARVPVVVSDACGAAAQVESDSGRVLSLDRPIEDWVAALDQQLARSESPAPFVRSWRNVAEDYARVYGALTQA